MKNNQTDAAREAQGNAIWVLLLMKMILRWLPPWLAVRLYARICDQYAQGGYSGKKREVELRQHKLTMEVELDDWSERLAYVCGFYYDVDGTQLLSSILKPGDQVVDVGANVGFVSLIAAKQVGPNGLVLSIEPNIRLAKRLELAATRNVINNLRIEQVALGERQFEARLSDSSHSGSGTLRATSESGHSVQVCEGCVVLKRHLSSESTKPIFVKIDVEGYEHRVVLGLRSTLEGGNVALYIEVTDEWLKELGSSAAKLIADLRNMGYTPLALVRTLVGDLKLIPYNETSVKTYQYDLLFIRIGSTWEQRARESGLFGCGRLENSRS